MVVSGLNSIAGCTQEFPAHTSKDSASQRRGLHYKMANGTLITNAHLDSIRPNPWPTKRLDVEVLSKAGEG